MRPPVATFFRDSVGLSVESLLSVLQALRAGWAISRGEAGDVRSMAMAGTIDRHGLVHLLVGVANMPALFKIEADRGPFKAGDRVLVEPGTWTAGKWVLVKHADGTHRLHMCELRKGLELLVGHEAVIYDEAAHEILGVAVDRVERL